MKNVVYIILTCILLSCGNHYSEKEEVSTLNIKWNKAYEDDSMDKAVIGLQWALSYLGANAPCQPNSLKISNEIITLHYLDLGFSKNANQVLEQLVYEIKKTEAYQKNKSIDLGRFVTLLLGTPEHYYNLAETPKTLAELKSAYTLSKTQGYVNNSSVGLQDRKLSMSVYKPFNQLWISEEIDSLSKVVYEYETIELLINGQLRFGIYDEEGFLKNAADPKHTLAGKPAKCMWCHESNLNPLFRDQLTVDGFMKPEELQTKIIASRDSFNMDRSVLKHNVEYSKTQQHTLTELLYISFLHPSAKRLSLEWRLPEAEVKKTLHHLKTHQYDEFPFLGNLYHRYDVDKLSPLKSIAVAGDVREVSAHEVNHLLNDQE